MSIELAGRLELAARATLFLLQRLIKEEMCGASSVLSVQHYRSPNYRSFRRRVRPIKFLKENLVMFSDGVLNHVLKKGGVITLVRAVTDRNDSRVEGIFGNHLYIIFNAVS